MFKSVCSIIIGFLFSLPLEAQKSVLLADGSIVDGLLDSTPICNVEETSESITVTYEFQQLNLLSDPLFPSVVIPRIKGFGYEHTSGYPDVPIRWDAISLPLNTQGNVSIIDSTFIDIPLELSPAREIRNCGDEEYTKTNVQRISSYEGFFPSTVIPSFEQHCYRGTPVLNVCVCPIKYNSNNKTTRFFSRIQYRITWSVNGTPFRFPSVEKCHSIADYLSNVTLNSWSHQGIRNQNTVTTEDYLIISTTQYQSAVERLAEWKRTLGFKVEILYQNGWSANNIKTYIQQFDSLHSNLSYVLLFGGYNSVKSFNLNVNGISCASDHSYSCLDGDDFSDIFRGRILVSNITEAETIVDKIINYERNPVKSSSFYNTGINGALFEGNESGYEGTRAVLTSELIKIVLVDSLQKNINFVYFKTGATPTHWNPYLTNGNEVPESVLQSIVWDGTAKKMMNYINDGAFYTLFIGHGTWNNWSSLSLNRDSLDKLNNSIMYPVVFSMSCNTGNFKMDDCFAQHFCSMEGKGCVAIFAPTTDSQQAVTEILGMNMFDAIWPNSHFNPIYPLVSPIYVPTPTPTFRLGQILNQAIYKTRMTWNYYDVNTGRIFHCFGDPSMRIYTQQPTTFDNAMITRCGNHIEVNAGEANAEISFYNKTTGEVLRYKGIQYVYNCGTNDVSVCISGPNKIPYVDPIYLQNEVVNGPVEYNGGIIKAGYAVTDSKSYGNVDFHSGDITIKGNSVDLEAGSTVELGTELTIEIR